MEIELPKLIAEIDFKDIKVKVYYDPSLNIDVLQSVWRMRNPDSCYTGVLFWDLETGERTYPKDAVIPIQTVEDREILPQVIITGWETINDKFIAIVNSLLELVYKRKNPNLN